MRKAPLCSCLPSRASARHLHIAHNVKCFNVLAKSKRPTLEPLKILSAPILDFSLDKAYANTSWIRRSSPAPIPGNIDRTMTVTPRHRAPAIYVFFPSSFHTKSANSCTQVRPRLRGQVPQVGPQRHRLRVYALIRRQYPRILSLFLLPGLFGTNMVISELKPAKGAFEKLSN